MTLVRQRYQLIYCRNVEDQRTLESDKTRGPPDVMQPKVLVSYVTFSWWIYPYKKSINHLIASMHVDWTWGTPIHIQTKAVVSNPTLKIKYWFWKNKILIFSRDILDQRTQQSDW